MVVAPTRAGASGPLVIRIHEVPWPSRGVIWLVGELAGGCARQNWPRRRWWDAAAADTEGAETPGFAVAKWHDECKAAVELLLSDSIPTYVSSMQHGASPVRFRDMMTLKVAKHEWRRTRARGMCPQIVNTATRTNPENGWI